MERQLATVEEIKVIDPIPRTVYCPVCHSEVCTDSSLVLQYYQDYVLNPQFRHGLTLEEAEEHPVGTFFEVRSNACDYVHRAVVGPNGLLHWVEEEIDKSFNDAIFTKVRQWSQSLSE